MPDGLGRSKRCRGTPSKTRIFCYYPVGSPTKRPFKSFSAFPASCAYPASCTVGRLFAIDMHKNVRNSYANDQNQPCCVDGCAVLLAKRVAKRWKYCVIPGEGRLWLCCGIRDKAHQDMRAAHAFIDWTRAEQKRDLVRRERSAISVWRTTGAICICEGCIAAHSCSEVVR